MTNEEKIIVLLTKINLNITRTRNYESMQGRRHEPKYNFGPDMRPAFPPHRRFSQEESNENSKKDSSNNFDSGELNLRRPYGGRGRCSGGLWKGHGGGFGLGRERLLIIVKDNPGISQGDLAEIVDIRPQSLSEIVSKLVTDGYIKKINNENDKRVFELYLTPEGEIRADEFCCQREKFASQSLSTLTEEEQLQLINLLEKINY